LFDDAGRALVFGAGLLVEAAFLADKGWFVDALETPDSVARRDSLYSEFSKRPGCAVLTSLREASPPYDIVVATHVLEFIEDPEERSELLSALVRMLGGNGRAYLSLRGWADVLAAKSKIARGDGIVTGLGTWTRGFTIEEAVNLIERAGLEIEMTPHTERARAPEQIRLVCRAT
jgi:hypothetical protein